MFIGILLAMGLLPLLLGFFLNWYVQSLAVATPALLVAAILLLALWGAVSFWAVRAGNGTGKVLLLLHPIPLLALTLVLVQLVVLGRFFPNPLGIWPQLYYLPLMEVGFRLAWRSGSMALAYAACFLLLAAASLAGCALGRRGGSGNG